MSERGFAGEFFSGGGFWQEGGFLSGGGFVLDPFARVCRTSRILETAMGTTTMKTKCSVFKLPKDGSDKQTSLNVLPQRNGIQINPAKFFICERPKQSPRVKLPGGYSRQLFRRVYLIVLYLACRPLNQPPRN